VLACSSLVFLENCNEEGLCRPGEDEDKRGEVDLRPLSCSSVAVSDAELLGLADELAEI